MSVRDERQRLADRSRDITVRTTIRPARVEPPACPDDLPDYLRALRRLADADELEGAHDGCTYAIELAGRAGDAASLAMAYSQRSATSRRRGDLPAARSDADAAASLPPLTGPAAGLLLARRIAVHLDLGDPAAGDALLAAAGMSGDLPDDPEHLLLRYVRGGLHSLASRPGEAVEDFYRCGERLAVHGFDRPTILPWRSAAASVLIGLGASEAAERLVAEEVALARRRGPASSLGRALRVLGRVVPGPAGLAAAEESVRVLRRGPRRFELATALVDLGILLGAARRRPQARRVLRQGLELAEACGSPALVARAQTALSGRAPGAPPGGVTG
jgi:tetratricopeptide (TPR) repeat protein